MGDDIGEPDPESVQTETNGEVNAEPQNPALKYGQQSSQEVIEGARNQDQLDKLKNSAE